MGDNVGQLLLSVKDFTITPGPRDKDEGSFSGIEFRENFMISKFENALNNNLKLYVNLDGTIGYGTSWLEEVFGGLARDYGVDNVLKTIKLITEEEPYLEDDIIGYIKDAK